MPGTQLHPELAELANEGRIFEAAELSHQTNTCRKYADVSARKTVCAKVPAPER